MKISLKPIKYVLLISGCLSIFTFASVSATSLVQVHVCPDLSDVRISQPLNNEKTDHSSQALVGQAKPGTNLSANSSGKANVVYQVSSSGKFSISLPLNFGANNLHLTASNSCSQSRSFSFRVYRYHSIGPSKSFLIIIFLSAVLIIIVLVIMLFRRTTKSKAKYKK